VFRSIRHALSVLSPSGWFRKPPAPVVHCEEPVVWTHSTHAPAMPQLPVAKLTYKNRVRRDNDGRWRWEIRVACWNATWWVIVFDDTPSEALVPFIEKRGEVNGLWMGPDQYKTISPNGSTLIYVRLKVDDPEFKAVCAELHAAFGVTKVRTQPGPSTE